MGSRQPKRLTAKHARFCLEYMKDSNGQQAAIRAGYAPHSARITASKLLTSPNVKARLAELRAKVESKAIMTADEVLTEISLLARTDMADYVTVDEGGAIKVKTFAEMPAGASKAIRKIKEKRVIRESKGDTPDVILESTLELEFWSKTDALDMLGRHRDLFKPKDGDADKGDTIVNIHFEDAQPPKKP